MRIPPAANLESRDGTVAKDARVMNGLVEGQGKKVRKRPGNSSYKAITDGGAYLSFAAQLLTYWNGIKVIAGDRLFSVSGTVVSFISTTWNSADKGAAITLSGGDLTVSGTATGLVRSVSSYTASLLYGWGVYINSGSFSRIGMANSSESVNTYCGATSNGISYGYDGSIVKNGIAIATVATYGIGDNVNVLYDVASRTVSFYKGTTLVYTATGANVPSGNLYACISYSGVGGSTASFSGTSGGSLTGNTSIALSPTTASLPFSAQDNGSNAGTDYLMFKNASQAWTLKPSGTPTLITDVDYPGISTVVVTGITRSGSTVTATTASDTNFQVGSAVTIAGATQTEYNGAQTITGVTASSTKAAVEIPITITRSGTTATATSTTQPHGFVNGQVVPIRGANQAEYNGDKTITWISAVQFSFTVTVTGVDISTPAGGSPVINPYATPVTIFYTAANSTNTAVITNPADYGSFVNGQNVTINDYGIGTKAITLVDSRTFTFTGVSSNATFSQGTVATGASPTVSSITSSGQLATVTTSAAHNYATGKVIGISGATPIGYNGQVFITVTGSTTFTYPLLVANASPVSPATGPITCGDAAVVTGASFTYSISTTPATPATTGSAFSATGGRNTVPGIAYLNGYFIVMDVAGVIYNSAIDNPTSWVALDYTTADAESGDGKCLARSLNFIIALKEWSTEFFTDAKNPTGSPLSPVENAFTLIGCASGPSVAQVDGKLVWVAQARQRGRSVYAMAGTQQQLISTPDVDRILNADDLAEVYAYGLKLDGHALYVLTLVTSNITLVYDFASQHWTQWTSLTVGSTLAGTPTITRSGTTATYSSGSAHGMSDGDAVLISGCTQTDYNGIFQISYVSTTSFTFQVANSPATPATGSPVLKPYTETYFKFTHYADCAGLNLVLHKSDGYLYKLDSALYRDAGIPIDFMIRTQQLDGGTLDLKKNPKIKLVTNALSDIVMCRWSDDDYTTNSTYRPIDLATQRPNIRRCGSFRQRSLEFKHIGNTLPIVDAIELEVSK